MDPLHIAAMADKWRERLRERMVAQGFNPTTLARAASLGQTSVRDILDGMSGSPRLETLEKIAAALGVSLISIYVGNLADPQNVAIIGRIRDADSWLDADSSKWSVQLRTDGEETVGIEVDGPLMAPLYRDGDVLIGTRVAGSHADNLVGQDCIIKTTDGRRYVRFLQRGSRPGHFNLRSANAAVPDVENVKLEWVAPIEWIRRRTRRA